MEKQSGRKLGLLPRLALGILAGVLLGLFVSASVIGGLATIKNLLGSLIFFAIPLVIFGFIAPVICDLKANAGKMLSVFLLISYLFVVGASLFSAVAGYILIPFLHISLQAAELVEVPRTVFSLNIQPIMPVMTALVLTILGCSILAETFFAMTISPMLYGSVLSIGTMFLFFFLFGVFAVGASGVPGGTIMDSRGIVISILRFNKIGIGLLLAIFALQGSFGTACNVTGDGAFALILRGIFYKPDGTVKQA